MPLLDLFKKSPQAQPPGEDLLGSPALQKRRYDGAIEFLGFIEGAFILPTAKPMPGPSCRLWPGWPEPACTGL